MGSLDTEGNISILSDNVTTMDMKWDTPLPWYGVLSMSLMGAVAVTGVGNYFALRFIFHSKDNSTAINEIVAAILVTNTIRCHGTSFMEMAEIYTNFSFRTRYYCRVRGFLQAFSISFSTVSTVLAVIRAYVCIRMIIMKLSKKSARCVIVISALLSCILAFFATINNSPFMNVCLLTFGSKDNTRYYILATRAGLIIALSIIMLGCYLSIFILIWLKKRNLKAGHRDLFTLKFGVFVSCIFTLGHLLPFIGIFVIPKPFHANPLRTAHMSHLLSFVSYFDTMVDPIIFAVQNKYFRKYLRSFVSVNTVAPQNVI